MTTLEQQAREAAERILPPHDGPLSEVMGGVFNTKGIREREWIKMGYLAAAEPREKMIAELEAMVAELEARVPRWVLILSAEENELTYLGWGVADRFSARDSAGNPLRLMIPPIPVPAK